MLPELKTKAFPFTIKDIISAVGNNQKIEVDFCSCWVGGKHKYHYVSIGGVKFQDNGKFSEHNPYGFAEEVCKLLTSMENELRKKNIVFMRKKIYMPNGYSNLWHSVNTNEIEVIDKMFRIKPCKAFTDLQKWLQKHANFNLQPTDMFACDVCQKRSDKWYSNFHFYADNESYCDRLLKGIKASYKSGYKVTAELLVDEDIDRNPDRYEYEQYGYKTSKLSVIVSTPTGRNAKRIV